MNILGIETSCDETAAAIVKDGKEVLSSVVASSAEMHRKYGGIVPEIAARKQVESMIPVLTETMQRFTKDDIDAIAVTIGPGLIGSLLIGVETAKALAFVWTKPIIPVNHVLAHVYANFIHSPPTTHHLPPMQFPIISLVVSGGHTELYLMPNAKELKWLGGTLDDAAGEAFDKAARLLGFANRGGAAIETAASKLTVHGSQFTVKLPRPLLHDESLNFSFSGLKTAFLREVNSLKKNQQFNNLTIQQLAYELQEAITDVLVTKTLKAAKLHSAKSILISGGVAANKRLREKFSLLLTNYNLQLFAPAAELCTDNAATIAACAFYQNSPVPWQKVIAQPDLSVEEA